MAQGSSALEEAQHAAGRLTARERVEVLLDPGSFRPAGTRRRGRVSAPDVGSDFACGRGRIDGRPAAVCAFGGAVWDRSFAEKHAAVLCATIEAAARRHWPLVSIFDIPGMHVDAGPGALAGYARALAALARAAGAMPRIALVAGPCAGAAALAASPADFTVMVRGASHAWLSGPEVAHAVAQEAISGEALGGADVHAARSGLADRAFDNEIEALLWVRRLLAFLPAGDAQALPVFATADPPARREPALERLFAGDGAQPEDMRELVRKVVDEADLCELGADFAPGLITGLARMAGAPVGVLANQPAVLAGCLDRAALGKAARFVRACDRFGIPLLVFVDAPGFLPGSAEEHGGIVRAAGELVRAIAAAGVPVVRVVPRRAWGGPALAMGMGGRGATLAWRGAEIGLLGSAAAAGLSRDGTAASAGGAVPADPPGTNLAGARSAGLVDAVIAPARTREHLCRALGRRRGSRGPRSAAR